MLPALFTVGVGVLPRERMRQVNVPEALTHIQPLEFYGIALPWSADGGPSGFSAVLHGLCEQHGFPFLDLKPTLVEASRQDYEKSGALLWWRDDTHWNGDGQRAAAATIYNTY